MKCLRRSLLSKNHSSSQTTFVENSYPSKPDNPNTTFESETVFQYKPARRDEQVFLQIPLASLHLIDEGESIELTRGDFQLLVLAEESARLATVVKIGDVQWPLAKDEPVVKIDDLHYLFTLPDQEGEFLSYGVSFSADNHAGLVLLDSVLTENSCFSALSSSKAYYNSNRSSSQLEGSGSYWKGYAPRIDDYNGVLAKAIAGGTGEIVKGVFKCRNAYCEQVSKGGEMVRTRDVMMVNAQSSSVGKTSKAGGIKRSVKRVRKVSKMTEKISRALLDGVLLTTGSVAGPMVRAAVAGNNKHLPSMIAGELLLASLDSVNTLLEAIEVAEKEAFSTTTGIVTGMVSRRFGENAGEVAEDVFATAGHAIGTAWNVFKLRKAINPTSTLSSTIVNSAGKKCTNLY